MKRLSAMKIATISYRRKTFGSIFNANKKADTKIYQRHEFNKWAQTVNALSTQEFH